jgi:hypothetical protein
VGALLQQPTQYGRTDADADADADALQVRGQVEVLQPVGVLGRPQRDAAGERAAHLDHPCAPA